MKIDSVGSFNFKGVQPPASVPEIVNTFDDVAFDSFQKEQDKILEDSLLGSMFLDEFDAMTAGDPVYV